MDHKKTLKKYIYERDGRRCFFCGKDLLFRQVSLDHYLPKSHHGPDDVFNIVLSCKKCNRIKKNRVPEDFENIMIENLKTAVMDRKIKLSGIKIKNDELMKEVEEVNKIEDMSEYTVFQGKVNRFYVKNDTLYKFIKLG